MGFMGIMCLFNRLANYLFSTLVTFPSGYSNAELRTNLVIHLNVYLTPNNQQYYTPPHLTSIKAAFPTLPQRILTCFVWVSQQISNSS